MHAQWTAGAQKALTLQQCGLCFTCLRKSGKQACALISNPILAMSVQYLSADQWAAIQQDHPDLVPVRPPQKRQRKQPQDLCSCCEEQALTTTCAECDKAYCSDCKPAADRCHLCTTAPLKYCCNHCGADYVSDSDHERTDPTCHQCGHYTCWQCRSHIHY